MHSFSISRNCLYVPLIPLNHATTIEGQCQKGVHCLASVLRTPQRCKIVSPSMKPCRGHLQRYNAQAMVTKEQIIVAAKVTQQQNDVQQLQPMLNKTDEELNAAGVKDKVRESVFL